MIEDDTPDGEVTERNEPETAAERPTLAHAPLEPPEPPTPQPDRQRVELRDAAPSEIATVLRALMGLTPDEPAPGEVTASLPEPLPPRVQRLDAGAWISWCLVGLPLFGDGLPSLRRLRSEGNRLAMGLAMLRERGNISQAARVLRTSRKVLRDNLRSAGLYPWGRGVEHKKGASAGDDA